MSSSAPTIHKAPWNTTIHRVLEIVARAPGCRLSYVAELLPDVTRREILVSLCYLKQSRQLDVVMGEQGALLVTLSPRLFH